MIFGKTLGKERRETNHYKVGKSGGISKTVASAWNVSWSHSESMTRMLESDRERNRHFYFQGLISVLGCITLLPTKKLWWVVKQGPLS